MSLDLEHELRVFYASAPQTKRKIDVLEFSHSAMTKTYYLWNQTEVGEVTTEDGLRTVTPAHFEVKPAGSEPHLDQVFEIALDTTDPADDFRIEMARIQLNTTERVRCVFREYLSDALDDMQTCAVLQVEDVAYKLGAARIRAVQPRMNVLRTGENYSPRDLPMMRP